MSILLNSTHEAQPWWDYDKTVWDDITPQRSLHQDEYFGKKGWEYSSADIDWPSSKLVREYVGSLDTLPIITFEGEFPIWVADFEIVDRSLSLSGEFPEWTSDFHILSGDLLTFAGTFPQWTGLINIPSGVVSFTGKFPRWSSNVTILSGGLFTFESSFPLWTSSVIITPDVGNFVISATFPLWSGIIQVRSVVSVYGGIVMNASNYAVTEYKDFPIKSIGYMNGHYYGVLSDGVYKLEGSDDAGTDIDAEIETGPIDFGEKFLKRPREAWFVFRSDGTVILRIRLDEQDVYEEELACLNDRLREGRVKFGRGVKNRFSAFGFKNKDGSDIDLDSISVIVDPIRGRVR